MARKRSIAFVLSTLFFSSALISCSNPTPPQAIAFSSNDSVSIINGREASPHDLWTKSVVGIATIEKGHRLEIFCTGTLIAGSRVVTAAHCLEDLNEPLVIVFGLSENSKTKAIRDVTSFAMHEQYDAKAEDTTPDIHDIGVIHFSGKMPSGYHEMPVLEDYSVLFDGMNTLVGGFGITDSQTEEGAGTLRYTEVEIRNVAHGEHEIQTDESQSATCSGDSGGPAFIHHNGQYKIWGVTSRGDDNCNRFGIYTRVDRFVSWLMSH